MSQLDKNEAQRIYTLSKNPNALLKDKKAIDEIRKFAKNQHLGEDSKLINALEIYEKCSVLLLEQEQALTMEIFQELLQLGIGPNERKELRQSLNGDRIKSNRIIQAIQEKFCNNLLLQDEFVEFTEFVLSKAR
ncbi:hypothetical protein KR044_006085 [Drosophila immigrans]|nr:hypothetical protein KR044_006085 [Drosophila immigrans]